MGFYILYNVINISFNVSVYVFIYAVRAIYRLLYDKAR